jgi:hypothetical protein
MLGIASPTGYLELDEEAITRVTPTGRGTVNGNAVSEYRVSTDPSRLENDPECQFREDRNHSMTLIERTEAKKYQSKGPKCLKGQSRGASPASKVDAGPAT